ncbi:Brain mitochondrial carrier protein 1 precursor [Paragonimus heterotremus]|uniref:Brain mitochondrial carrier protein 1 n=1 Tax=Paragonimus heterotremus TaxID=100268 RepID=A0A8J4TEM1_9TREM|nr:Brain mitochondrial carrier protein 1 precursor [Paragonimus heterotremus]
MSGSTEPKALGWRPFVYGGIASIFAETCTFPIDTSKTRLQIQGEMISGSAAKFVGGPYRGMLHCIATVGRIEGARSLYQGLTAAIIRQCIYGTIKFGLYNHMKRMLVADPMDETLVMDVVCAMFAGGFSNAIANPADMLKIRMQAFTAGVSGRPSLLNLARKAIHEEGPLALYKGVNPTALRAAVVCGVELPVYDISKKWLILSGLMGDTKSCHFVASFLAGLGGALMSNPVDVTRTRLLNQRRALASRLNPASPSVQAKIYRNAFDCMYQTVKYEGILALWKGFIPNWMRLGPWNIIFFMTFEQLGRLPF